MVCLGTANLGSSQNLLGLKRENCYSLKGLKKLNVKRVMDTSLGEERMSVCVCVFACVKPSGFRL